MKSKFKNVNEQIERIKSLFNEDRLYGNLIKEHDYIATPEQAIDYLEKDGYIVQEPGSSATKAVKRELYGCLTDDSSGSQVDTVLGKIYKEVKSLASNIKIEVREDSGTCILLFSLRAACDLNTHDNIVASIYEDAGVYKIQVLYNVWKFANLGIFDTDLTGVKWVGYEGQINTSTTPMKYVGFKYNGLYTRRGTFITGTGTGAIGANYLKTYNYTYPCDLSGTPPTTFWPRLDKLLFDQTGMTEGNGDVIKLLEKIKCIEKTTATWKRADTTTCT